MINLVNWIKRYWIELALFGIIFGVFMIDLAPDYTWSNTNSDGIHLTYAAKYLYPAHKGSAPIYLLLGHLILQLPVGTEFWRMGLLSAIPSLLSAIMIYFIIKEKIYKYTIDRKNHSNISNFILSKYFALIGALIYGSSALVISQSTIAKYYPLVTLMILCAYYFIEKSKWKISSLFIGASCAIHPLGWISTIIFIVGNKDLRKWKQILIIGSFFLFYLYIPITNRAPYMWQSPNNSQAGILGFIGDTWATAVMLSGGISIWELPKRILDAAGILGVSFGIGIILLVFAFWKFNKSVKWYKDTLFWLVISYVLYYCSDLAPQTYVYMLPTIAFGCIVIGVVLSRIKNWKLWAFVICGTSLIMLGINVNYFDIGRTLDKNLSAKEFYEKELPKVPDGQILLAQQGWEWAAAFPYNMNNNKNIIPVAIGTLASKNYQDLIHSWGVKFDIPKEKVSLPELQDYITMSIIQNNDNVWTTIPNSPETYGAKIVLAKENIDKIRVTPRSIINGSQDMIWKWKPSNPYNIITGSIEVNEWIYIIFSNYSVLTFSMMAGIGAVPMIIGYQIIKKKKK